MIPILLMILLKRCPSATVCRRMFATMTKYNPILSQEEPKDDTNNFLLLDPIPTLPTGPTSKGNLVILWFLR